MAAVLLAWGDLPLGLVAPLLAYASMVFVVGWLVARHALLLVRVGLVARHQVLLGVRLGHGSTTLGDRGCGGPPRVGLPPGPGVGGVDAAQESEAL